MEMNWKEKIINGFALVISVFIGIVCLYWVVDYVDVDLRVPGNVSQDDYKEINPKLILQKRYADGEIDSLEYLERMVRL